VAKPTVEARQGDLFRRFLRRAEALIGVGEADLCILRTPAEPGSVVAVAENNWCRGFANGVGYLWVSPSEY
jgi:hypothetical protein